MSSRRWFCTTHHAWTSGDCPKCDDELIAMTEEVTRGVDHRGHERERDWSGHGWRCVDCSDEIADVAWMIAYSHDGKPT